MTYMDVVISLAMALAVLPVISFLTSKLGSLPIDCATAALCLIATIAAKVSDLLKISHAEITYNWPYILVLLALFSFVFMVISIGFHFVRSHPALLSSGFGREVTYFLSLSISILYLWVSYRAIIKTEEVFSVSIAGAGELLKIAYIIFGDISLGTTAVFIAIYSLTFTLINRLAGESR